MKMNNLKVFEKMNLIRHFDYECKKAYDLGKMRCPVYLSIGQESIASTLSECFKPDMIFGQHRAHSHYIAYGGFLPKLVDELLGRETGCNRGRAGSPGIQDLSIGMMGHHGHIGENVPIGVGASLGDKSKKIMCVFGDGASEEDYVLSALGFAVTHKLPILFICEDNNLSILTEKSVRRSWEISDVAKSMGMNAVNISDNPIEIEKYVNKFKNKLPALINCRTCRHLWHAGTGIDGKPKQDRLLLYKRYLIKNGFSKNKLNKIENKTKMEAEKLWEKHLQKQ